MTNEVEKALNRLRKEVKKHEIALKYAKANVNPQETEIRNIESKIYDKNLIIDIVERATL